MVEFTYGLSFNVFYLTKAADWSHPFLLSVHQIYIFISHSGHFGRIFCPFSITEAQFPRESTFLCAYFISGKRLLCSLLYPVRQLHHVCRVDADEDVQDFR